MLRVKINKLELELSQRHWKMYKYFILFQNGQKKVTKRKPIKVIEEQSKSDFKTLKNYIRIFFLSQANCTVDSKITFPLIFSHEFHLKKIKLIFVPDFTKIHIIQQDIEFD